MGRLEEHPFAEVAGLLYRQKKTGKLKLSTDGRSQTVYFQSGNPIAVDSDDPENRLVRILAENGKKEGIVTLPSGLQYKVIEEDSGKTNTAEDSVTAHYRGTLINGEELDSSYGRGHQPPFPAGGVCARRAARLIR